MTWGNPQSFSERFRADLLQPVSWFYGVGNQLHRLWHHSVVRPTKISVPVISVGNITCGGTGKTPVVISLAQYLIGTGAKVCVVSRGYGKQGTDAITVVSDGQGNYADCRESGDEPLLIAMSVPGVIVIVGANRAAACQRAVGEFGCDIILLDDGFQHYPVARDLDIVLVDYADELRNDRLLPSGRLREPIDQLARAGHIVITKLPVNLDQARLRRIKAMVINRVPHASVNTCRFTGRGLTSIPFGQVVPFSSVKQHAVVAFCGLARPQRFFEMLKEEGINVVAEKSFPDHHWYDGRDLHALRDLKKASGANLMITTQKDAVKLARLGIVEDIMAMVIEAEWPEGVPASIYNLVVNMRKTPAPGIATLKMQAPLKI